MANSVRAGDTLARVGGDEFVILLWGLKDRLECDQTLSRIVSEVAEITALGVFDVRLRVSVGVTLFPQDGEDGLVLLEQADHAMYRAKVEGGSSWRYFRA
jgi:diguanylate cyclase (GGDEF)-like protein